MCSKKSTGDQAEKANLEWSVVAVVGGCCGQWLRWSQWSVVEVVSGRGGRAGVNYLEYSRGINDLQKSRLCFLNDS